MIAGHRALALLCITSTHCKSPSNGPISTLDGQDITQFEFQKVAPKHIPFLKRTVQPASRYSWCSPAGAETVCRWISCQFVLKTPRDIQCSLAGAAWSPTGSFTISLSLDHCLIMCDLVPPICFSEMTLAQFELCSKRHLCITLPPVFAGWCRGLSANGHASFVFQCRVTSRVLWPAFGFQLLPTAVFMIVLKVFSIPGHCPNPKPVSNSKLTKLFTIYGRLLYSDF